MNNPELYQFMEDLASVSPLKAEIIDQIRSYFNKLDTDIEERIIYGGVGFFFNDKHFGGAYPNKKHVNFAFSRGVELDDPKSLLQGKGKFRRHLQIFALEELEEKEAETFAKAIVELISRDTG